MKKSRFLVAFLLLFVMYIGDVSASYKGFVWNKGTKLNGKTEAITADYAFALGNKGEGQIYTINPNVKWSNRTSIGRKPFDINNTVLTYYDNRNRNDIINKYSILYRNVGTYYDGRKIDVRATVKDYEVGYDGKRGTYDKTGGEALLYFRNDSIGIFVYNIRYVTIQYSFFESGTETPIEIKGNTTYYDVDEYQGINFDGTKQNLYINGKFNTDKYNLSKVSLKDGTEYVYDGSASDCEVQDYKYLNNSEMCTGYHAFTETFVGKTITRTFTFGQFTKSGWGWIQRGGNSEFIAHSVNATVEVKKKSYFYSMDMACTNCTSDYGITDNKAYVLQDTTDWNAIIDGSIGVGDSPQCTKLKNHFKQGSSNIYCREEYYVYLPTKKDADATKIKSGRYFTLNDFSRVADIPNFNPVKIKKVRECKSTNNTGLEDFDKKNSLKGTDMGKLSVDFSEENAELYNFSGEELKSKENYYKHEIKNNVLRQEVEYSYTLPEGFYRYVNMADGKVIMKMNDTLLEQKNFKDLGVSTLPISFESDKASVTFKYQPSLRMQNYGNDNNGLNCYGVTGNIYNAGNLSQTACYKLFSDATQRNNCVNNMRKGISSCLYNNANHFLARKTGSSHQEFYTCNLNGEDDPNCNKDNHDEYSRDWNPVENRCCPSGQKFYEETGQCVTEGQQDSLCEIVNGKYYYKSVEVSEEVFNYYCRNCSENKTPCYDGTCPDSNTSCPPPPLNSMKDIIYRVIDNNNPFIGKEGLSRKTGVNWCQYDDTTKDYKCNYNNNLVKKVINDNQTVYSSDHILYKATLNPKNIRDIRDYNKKNSYSDWDLKCINNEVCFSDFLDKYGNVEGKCSSNSSDLFYTCIQ